MKRIVLFITALLLFAGCAKEQLVEERSYTGPVTVIEATFESLNNGATKAEVTDAGTFTWQNGDKAAFTASSSSLYYTGTNSSTSATADFTIYGAPTFTSSSFAFFPSDLTTGKSTSSLDVTVPATREWVKDQTNVAMYGVKVENEASFNFSHMGGLVRVRVNNVPTNARKFVFRTPDYKISGDFTAVEESSFKVIKTKKHETENSVPESEQTYTLTWTTAPTPENTMDFYIPLPLGTYANGFAFKFLDETNAEILSKTSSQSETIARKDLVLMPAITLVGGSIEPAEKAAVVANIPAGYSGDYLLPQSEKVILKINASDSDKDITLKYDEASIPTNLEVKVVDGDNAGNYNAKLLGTLPYTHVKFTQGNIDHTELTTSSSTLAVIYPATIGTLTVKGGNVVLQGATVNMIEVAEGAVADASSSAPVEIKMEKYTPTATGSTEQTPKVTGSVVAKANVQVAPVAGETVTVVKVGTVNVEDTGEGTVKQENDEVSVSTFEDFKNAVDKVVAGQTIKVAATISDAQGITVAEGKQFTVDFGGFTYTCASNPAGSDGTKNQVFQLLQNSTITFKNGTIDVAVAAKENFRFIIQNYANLTLEDITLDGSNLAISDGRVNYTVSNNSGSVEFKGKTNIKAADTKGVAFDAWDDPSYDGVPQVTVNTTGTIEGQVEVTGGTLVVEAGTFKTTGARRSSTANHQSPTLLVTSGNVTVNGGSFTSEHDVAVRAEGGTVTLNNGTFTAPEGAVCFPGAGATINIVGGTYTASDNAVLIGQGSAKDGDANTVNISGGTFTGNISSSGYIACGIYAPWKDNITVTGGTFNITNGAGVVARAGVVTINGGTFNCTGNISGGVGDKTVALPCECLVFDDSKPDYPARTVDSKIVVKKGTFSDESAIKYAANDADINIALQANRNASGIFLGEKKNVKVTFDLGGKTLNFKAPAVGSSGTENQAFHIEQGNQLFTLKNGKVTIDANAKGAFRFIIQNYNDLTVDGVELDGTNLAYNVNDKVRYTVSNNQGTVNFTGNTTIKAAADNGIAFDVCKNGSYTAPTVTWASTGTVTGGIELTGGKFVVSKNLAVSVPVMAESGESILEIGSGATLSAADNFSDPNPLVKTKTATAPVQVKRGASLTINGQGTVGGTKTYSAVLVTVDGDEGETKTATLTVDGNVTLQGDYYGIAGNGSRHNTKITVKGGTIMGLHNNDNLGIYHPQEGTLTISGGTITGYSTAVELRAGTLSVTGGTLESTADTYSCVKSDGGTTTVGAALAIAQHNTKKDINVTLSGGTFEGLRTVNVENPQNNDGANVSVSISGGTYNATDFAVFNNDARTTVSISDGEFKATNTASGRGIAVYARLGSVNITGGTFENNNNSEATLHVGCPDAVTGNKTPYLTISGIPTVKNIAEGPYTWGQQGSAPLTVNMANELTYKAVSISGGEYHGQSPEKDDSWTSESDTHKYFLATGYEVSGDETNGWTVVSANQN